jgi:sugar lactone lactonase YvrE
MTSPITTATAESFSLAEGPLWDPVRRQLLWVDIDAGTVFVGALDDDGTIAIVDQVPIDETVGAVVVSERGEWLVAGRNRLILVDLAGRTLPLTETVRPSSRYNDGKVDPLGRFVVGTLSLGAPSETEQLIQFEADGAHRVIDADLTLSNGLAWTADGTVLYSVDTLRQVVFRRSYDAMTGQTGPREVFLTFQDGYPDGMTIDADEHLWIAMWGLGEVRRYTPAGRLETTISVPAPHTSSVAFAGPGLDTLVITTATQDLDEQALTDFPLSGRLFTARPGVRGLPQPLWSGTPDPATETPANN